MDHTTMEAAKFTLDVVNMALGLVVGVVGVLIAGGVWVGKLHGKMRSEILAEVKAIREATDRMVQENRAALASLEREMRQELATLHSRTTRTEVDLAFMKGMRYGRGENVPNMPQGIERREGR